MILTGNYCLSGAGQSAWCGHITNAGLAIINGNTVRGSYQDENGFYVSKDSSVPTQYGTSETGNVLSNLGGTGFGFGSNFVGGVTIGDNTLSAVRTNFGALPNLAAIGVNTINGAPVLGDAGHALIVQGIGTITLGHLVDSDIVSNSVVFGFNITEPQFASGDLLKCTGTLASGTVTLPPAPNQHQQYTLSSQCTIANLTILAPGMNVANPPTILTPGTAQGGWVTFIYETSGQRLVSMALKVRHRIRT